VPERVPVTRQAAPIEGRFAAFKRKDAQNLPLPWQCGAHSLLVIRIGKKVALKWRIMKTNIWT
jgi:hypothetical protein